MGLFSLDIERYYNEQMSLGNNILGIFTLQYPIYCIHANISDVTPNPLDNLDRAIVQFIAVKDNISTVQLSALLGTSNTLTKQRIAKLIQDGLIEYSKNGHKMTENGERVFNGNLIERQHKGSYDFYIDGINFQPLTKVFYGYYKYKFISEHDSYLKTWKNGKETLVRPFGPDLVHTPPDKTKIISEIYGIKSEEREDFSIPIGLQTIEDLAYTKLSLQLMVSVLKKGDNLNKVLIDPFTIYSISDEIPYSQALVQNVGIFYPKLQNKIKNLEFKLFTKPNRDDDKENIPILTSNWSEIDKSKDSENRCFNFTKDDLIKAIKVMYGLKTLDNKSIINSSNSLEINITKDILLDSNNKGKLINDLIRKRDYKFGNIDLNVFLMYIHYTSNDEYVNEIVRFKQLVHILKGTDLIDNDWINTILVDFEIPFRELCISSGELDLLEKIDIINFMAKFI
jgi:hypothetical protein